MENHEEVAAEKARLRERFRAARLALPESVRAEASRVICDHLLALPEIAALSADGAPGRRAVGMFWPRVERAEVDVAPLVRALHRRGVPTVFPRVVAPGEMTWHQVSSDTDLQPGRWGLLEPAPSAPAVPLSALRVVVVPGLAFGADGSRLGWGGGFYDRVLAGAGALAVGVTFAAALVESVPSAAHDARMDVVTSERGVLRLADPEPHSRH